MNVNMKLTFDGLVRALRFKQLALREDIAIGGLGARYEPEKFRGEQNGERRGSIAEGTL
ncbi:hypothetical protein CEV31_1829 [Brucella thiophenivorans]|uniref:Uncharacterized protein n=2 Tax=Brucella thiophenivorans TaxID=571255 RepID=A0A256FXH0_9HYPH|nr:hypothetical protein CEV31_1829 [Brucella thiophenivorans]